MIICQHRLQPTPAGTPARVWCCVLGEFRCDRVGHPNLSPYPVRRFMASTYRDAGVDLDIYAESMGRLPALMHRTFSPRVIRSDGGFAGLFRLDFDGRLFARNYRQPVLVSGTDGVGTKLKIAQTTGRHGTVGIDLVAMCVNDLLCTG